MCKDNYLVSNLVVLTLEVMNLIKVETNLNDELIYILQSKKYIIRMGSACQIPYNEQVQNQSQIKHKDDLTSKLKFYSIEVSQLGEVQIYQYKESFLAKVIVSFQKGQQMRNKIRILNCLTHINKNLPFVYKIQAFEKGTCSNKFVLIYFINHYTFTLGQHLLNTLKKQKLLNNGQIWYILKSLAQSGLFFQNRKIYIKRFNRNRIWISPIFEIKLDIDDLSLQNQNNQHLNQLQCELFAPQEMKRQTDYNSQKNTIDPYKARVFSLGMMILECYTGLDSIIGYYSFADKNIDLNSLNKDIKQISDKYLASVLSRMLQSKPQKRLDFRQVLEFVDLCSNYVHFQQSLNIS